MEPELNPYRPGAGLQPPELAGRQDQIGYFDFLIIRAKRHNIDRGMIMSGLRGVGKTALMNKLVGMAETHSWICVVTEGQTSKYGVGDVRRRLGSEIQAALVKFSIRQRINAGMERLSELVGRFSVTVGPVSLEHHPQPGATGLLDLDVEELVTQIARAAQDRGSAFAIFVDEMQDLDPELLSALLVVQHKTQQQGLPFYLIGTGLPNLPAALTTSRSYAERLFNYSVIGPLNDAAAADALEIPAQRVGCSYTPEAVRHLIKATNGYPYFLQEYGRAIWNLAGAKTFTLDDARAAIRVGQAQLDAGFFPTRWERATPREREYMAAMATSGDESVGSASTAEIARTLGQDREAFGPARQSLIRKGLIYVPERGRVAFSVPGMADYIARVLAEQDDN
ncbi:MAG: ATP-binding protein [Propionibacteriaceae bacterium]|nr:ATP-binding protein [Propionibacteriaceae bacterium]